MIARLREQIQSLLQLIATQTQNQYNLQNSQATTLSPSGSASSTTATDTSSATPSNTTSGTTTTSTAPAASASATSSQPSNLSLNGTTGGFRLARQLSQGMTGDDVKVLQAALSFEADVYPEASISGYFGADTAAALSRFQAKNSLEVTGIADAPTLTKLNSFLDYNPIRFENRASGLYLCAMGSLSGYAPSGWTRAGGLTDGGAAQVIPSCSSR